LEDLALRVKLSVLWLVEEAAYLAYMTLGSLEPGAIEQVMAGEIDGMKIGPEILLLLAILLLIPLIMAFLPLTLKNPANRWTNIILGTVFAILEFLALTTLSSAWAILMTLFKVLPAVLVV
jgi:hypothetical protein